MVSQYAPLGVVNSLFHMFVGGLGDALVTLAVVVGAYIKYGMVVAVVPSDELVVFFDELEESVTSRFLVPALFYLCQQPTARDDGMCLEKFE